MKQLCFNHQQYGCLVGYKSFRRRFRSNFHGRVHAGDSFVKSTEYQIVMEVPQELDGL